MEQKDKELLLKDLCARLPYGVKGIITYDKNNTTFTVEGIDNNVLHLSDAEECYVEDFKPYLRPMSSMTKKEQDRYDILEEETIYRPGVLTCLNLIDFCNAHHLDYRGLIEKGLTIDAPTGMY